MSRVKWVDRALVRTPLRIGLCKSEKAYFKELRRLKVEGGNPWVMDGADATVHVLRNTATQALVALVCINPSKFRGERRSVVDTCLVHEAVHVWQRTREALRETTCGEEFEAYAIQNISRNLIDAYHER